MAHFRPLTEDGKKKIGHIFDNPELIPLRQYTPVSANIAGEQKLMWLVDWESLSETEQQKVLWYMSEKHGEPNLDVIREEIEKLAYFPIQYEWMLESYDMRHFM